MEKQPVIKIREIKICGEGTASCHEGPQSTFDTLRWEVLGESEGK